MPRLRSATTTTIGLLVGIIAALLIFLTHFSTIHSIVYTTYNGLISTFQLYELAWILATLDLLLDFSTPFPLLLWATTAIVIAILIRKVNAALTIVMTAVLFPASVWLLFAIKYANIIGFTIIRLLNFFLWQLLLPLALVLLMAGLAVTPFWAMQRTPKEKAEPTRTLEFACSSCGAVYRSKPLICVECGMEGLIQERLE